MALFAPLPLRVLTDQNLTGLQLRVLAVIAAHDRLSHARKQGAGCFARYEKLAAEVACHPKRLIMTLSELEAAGYVIRERDPENKRTRILRVLYEPAKGNAGGYQSQPPTGNAGGYQSGDARGNRGCYPLVTETAPIGNRANFQATENKGNSTPRNILKYPLKDSAKQGTSFLSEENQLAEPSESIDDHPAGCTCESCEFWRDAQSPRTNSLPAEPLSSSKGAASKPGRWPWAPRGPSVTEFILAEPGGTELLAAWSARATATQESDVEFALAREALAEARAIIHEAVAFDVPRDGAAGGAA